MFSLSYIKYKEKENVNLNKQYKTNQIIPKNKNILILISEIEEIVERRFLLMWQGLEIYLKDGRSYFFNLLEQSKYEKFLNILMENHELKQLISNRDYLSKHKQITKAWEDNLISTYEYLLLINKYASRSFNDANQYHIFPWIISKFKNLIYINNHERLLYEEKRKKSFKDEKSNMDNVEKINSLRNLKFLSSSSYLYKAIFLLASL